MKIWKIILLLVTTLGLSACLEDQNPNSFRMSYKSEAEQDVLLISFDAKTALDGYQSPRVLYNGHSLNTREGRENFARSLSFVRFFNDEDGMLSGGLNPSCTLKENDVQTITCALHFAKNTFPWNGPSAIPLVFPITYSVGNAEEDSEIITPALDFSKATRAIGYISVAQGASTDFSNINFRLSDNTTVDLSADVQAPIDCVGDACDAPAPAAPLDTDSDGTPDASDNCPFVDNEDQADQDDDFIGNTCDPAPSVPDEDFLRNEHGDEDYEGDGVLNSTDNCIYTSNEDQADLDNDGLGSICDETEPVVAGCRDNLSKNSLSVYAAADGCLGKDNSGANFGVFGPMSSSDGGFCALNPHSSTNLAPFAALFVGLSCLIARRRYE